MFTEPLRDYARQVEQSGVFDYEVAADIINTILEDGTFTSAIIKSKSYQRLLKEVQKYRFSGIPTRKEIEGWANLIDGFTKTAVRAADPRSLIKQIRQLTALLYQNKFDDALFDGIYRDLAEINKKIKDERARQVIEKAWKEGWAYIERGQPILAVDALDTVADQLELVIRDPLWDMRVKSATRDTLEGLIENLKTGIGKLESGKPFEPKRLDRWVHFLAAHPQAEQHFMDGLEMVEKGEYLKAAHHYQTVIELMPQIKMPSDGVLKEFADYLHFMLDMHKRSKQLPLWRDAQQTWDKFYNNMPEWMAGNLYSHLDTLTYIYNLYDQGQHGEVDRELHGLIRMAERI